MQFFDSPLVFHTANRQNRKINPSKRHISVEIEVDSIGANNNVTSVVRAWHGSIVEDGSLSDQGFEINMAPASGDTFVDQVVSICRALNVGNATVDWRCGLHVHVDARDFNYYDVRRLVRVYAKLESVLFKMCNPSRRGGRYSQECGQKWLKRMCGTDKSYKAVKKRMIEGLYDITISSGRGSGMLINDNKKYKHHEARYNALNVHSWFHRGTIECRIHEGTLDSTDIIAWGMLWAAIMDYAASRSDREIEDNLDNRVPMDVMKIVCMASPAGPWLWMYVHQRRNHWLERGL